MVVPAERLPAAKTHGSLLVVTNNRFWRGSIGSHARVASVVEHLIATGWSVTVAFCGRPYADDESVIRQQGLRVSFSQKAQSEANTGSVKSGAADDRGPPLFARVRQRMRHAQRW